MTMSEAAAKPRSWRQRLAAGSAPPMLAVLLALIVLWYVGTVWLNAPIVIDRYEREGNTAWGVRELVADTMAMERPVLPAPHQILAELDKTVLEVQPTSRRSLVYHGWVTLSSALLGFAFGAVLGIVLAAGIVHLRTLERSLLPWIIASQTVHPGDRADDHRRAGLDGLCRAGAQGDHLGLSLLLPGDHRHGQGADLARSHPSRPRAHLQCRHQ
ncbi:MAG: hypothetical protein ACLQJR_13770, partial [Stellaceae bacterium]